MANAATNQPASTPKWADLDDLFNDEAETVPTQEIFDRLVERQVEFHGTDLKQPCGEAHELLDLWSDDLGKDVLPMWRAAVARRQPGVNAVDEVPVSDSDVDEGSGGTSSAEEVAYMNDAELLGVDHPEMQELLQRNATFMLGRLYGQRDNRNTQDGKWQATTMPWLAWLQGQDKGKNSWGFTRHPEDKTKEGASAVLAEAIDGARTDSAIQTMYAVGLDIDSGAALDDVMDKLEELGLFAIVYTSHSHGKDKLVLKHDDIMRKMKLDESPNRTQIQTYLREHHKDRFDDDYIQSIEIEELRHQTKDGLRTILKTRPLDKFRVVLPLWEPVKLSDLGATVNQWKDAWADAVTGVGVNMLGVSFDATCSDVNRLFFTPRHPKGADWYSAVVMGRPLRFEDIEPYSKARYVKERDPGDPFAAGEDLDGGPKQRERFATPGGKDMNDWHRKHKERFLITDVLESYCDDKLRVAGSEKAGTVHLECPFEHEHSTEGGTATMAMNPDETEAGYWTVFCRHDSCNGRDKLEFVREMIVQGWFEEDVLWDDEWNIPLPDEDLPGCQPVATGTPIPLSNPLWDDGLVDDGWCKKKNANKIRDQIRRNLRKRASLVIVEGGDTRVFIHSANGRMPQVWKEKGFRDYFKNRLVRYKSGGKIVKIDPAAEFFEDDMRVTYAGTQFEPDLSKADPHKFNLFNGFPVDPVPGDWSLLRNHIRDNLIAGNGKTDEEDEYLFNYFMTWNADIFQNPSNKKGSAPAIRGEQGVGKSKYFDWLREALGGYAVKVSNKKHLLGNFTAHLDAKLFIHAEEAFWSGDKDAAGILKDRITGDTAMSERKNIDAVERPNYARLGFVSNSEWVIPTDDNADARRFFVMHAGTAQKQNGAYFNAIDDQMRNGGLAAMVHEFMTWNPADAGMSFDDLRSAPWTAARAEQASHSASAPKAMLLQIIEDGFFTDRDGMDVELSDTKTTRVRRAELAHVMQGKAHHGGARKAVRKAIEQVLGAEAWHDRKHKFEDGKRERFAEFPPLNELRKQLKSTYQ